MESLSIKNHNSLGSIPKKECNYIDIARFIGIWMVVFGHFPFTGKNIFFRDFVYTFHMPFFFLISGILYKQISFSLLNVKKVFISLIVPYFIYNVICAVIYYPFTHDNPINTAIGTLQCIGRQASGASWFFLSLFWIRIMALFLKDKMSFIIVSFFCVTFLILVKDITNPYATLWGIKPAICMFPFFAIGFLIKEKFTLNKSHYINAIVITLCLILISLYAFKFGRTTPSKGFSLNILESYLVGFGGSLAFLYISQYLLPLLKSHLILTISRGTMMIVGLHNLLISIFRTLTPHMPFYYSFIISLLITLLFYFPIKYTFNRFPIMFGKQRVKN